MILPYRPPLDWDAMLTFLQGRATPGVESVHPGEYARTVQLHGVAGWFSARPDPSRSVLHVETNLSEADLLPRIRRLFDLDADPAAVEAHLGRHMPVRTGLRVPGTVDGFELAVRTVLGQQISVRGATTLAGRLAARLGTPIDTGRDDLRLLFPSREAVAASDEDTLAKLGMPGARARTLLGLARAGLPLEPTGDPARAMADLVALPGIGEWTAQYLAMRVLRWSDGFPASDLGLRKAAGNVGARELERLSQAWRPYRAYAALQLWTRLATGGG